jgi:hypothetical protein
MSKPSHRATHRGLKQGGSSHGGLSHGTSTNGTSTHGTSIHGGHAQAGLSRAAATAHAISSEKKHNPNFLWGGVGKHVGVKILEDPRKKGQNTQGQTNKTRDTKNKGKERT